MSRKLGDKKFEVHWQLKEDTEVFGKTKRAKTVQCRYTGYYVKCNYDCKVCPYDIPRQCAQ